MLKIYSALPYTVQKGILTSLEDLRKINRHNFRAERMIDLFYFSESKYKNQKLKPYFCLKCNETHDKGKIWFDHGEYSYREGDTRSSYM